MAAMLPTGIGQTHRWTWHHQDMTIETEQRAAAQELAAWTSSLDLADVPAEVRAVARDHILDALGCGLAALGVGEALPGLAVAEDAGAGPASAIGRADRVPAAAAALANGMLCHGLDFDDTHEASIAHVATVVVPAAIAAAEAVGATGAQTLAAIVAATETVTRIGMAAPEGFHRRGFHPTGVADLFRRRLAVTHETDAGRRLAEGTVKRLTGGDRIKARRMREDFWEFEPSHTVVMVTNHRPVVRGDDEGIWRRVRLIPFEVVVAAAEQDPDLRARLAAEIDGVLAWAVAGYTDWQANGLNEPERVVTATADYRHDSDALGRFLDERCLVMAAAHVQSSALYTTWTAWARTEGIDPGSNKALTQALIDRGHEPPARTNRGAIWRGIGLTTDDEQEPSP